MTSQAVGMIGCTLSSHHLAVASSARTGDFGVFEGWGDSQFGFIYNFESSTRALLTSSYSQLELLLRAWEISDPSCSRWSPTITGIFCTSSLSADNVTQFNTTMPTRDCDAVRTPTLVWCKWWVELHSIRLKQHWWLLLRPQHKFSIAFICLNSCWG